MEIGKDLNKEIDYLSTEVSKMEYSKHEPLDEKPEN